MGLRPGDRLRGRRGRKDVSVQWVHQIEAFFAGIGGLEDFSVFSPNPLIPA
jgi:hypothetical protein